MKGLSSIDAKRKLKQSGLNEIKSKKKISPFKILVSQFTSPLIIILIAAAIILSLINTVSKESNLADIILIVIIVFISGISGFFQEYKAERSIEAIQNMSSSKTRVIRDGKNVVIPPEYLVPGDIILLSEGEIIPADAKVVVGKGDVDESILTGESGSVKKRIGDKIYMNTYLMTGKITAIIEKTGSETKVGELAKYLDNIKEEKSLFQKEIDNLSKKLFWIVVGIIIITGLIGLTKYSLYDSVIGAIALAVAAIPEGLPTVLILSLAIGANVMMKKKALVRKLGAIESIGNVNVICTDKTGTLTKSEMKMTKVFLNNTEYLSKKLNVKNIKELLLCSILNNNVTKVFDKKIIILGDETEQALYKFAKKFKIDKFKIDKKYKRIYELPFDSKRKMMSVIVQDKQRKTIYTKGAVENLLNKCDRILINGRIRKLTNDDKNRISKANIDFSSQALRVLGFAFKNVKKIPLDNQIENKLTWIGFGGIIDPPRSGVKNGVRECKSAGIRVIMLTGDNPFTARAIASQVGINTSDVLIGNDIDALDDIELSKKLKDGVNVFARISPVQKLRLLTVLKNEGNVVAMTGDGVNDSLALKKADVGIAMGIRGTDVSKQASDIILLNDNFVSIVDAIKEGRRTFENIRKFVNYLLTSNLAEVGVVFLSTLFLAIKDPLLIPIHLLWINLITDGFPALALGVDPARPNIMKDSPRKKTEHIINRKITWLISTIGIKKIIILLATFFIILKFYDFPTARTTLFTGFILYEFVRIGSIRSQENLGWFSNMWLVVALGASIVLQLIIIYSPINKLFKIVPLGIGPWSVLILGVIIGYFIAIWITNLIQKYVKN